MGDVRVVSIDSSTKKTGMALYVNGEYRDHILIDNSHIRDIDERINMMGKMIMEQLDWWLPSIIYIEEPKGEGRNVELVRKLCTIIGIVRGWAISHSTFFQEVKPSVWRKYVGISQGGKKRDELKAASVALVKAAYKIDVNDDVADAICIGKAMVNRYGNKENNNHDGR